MSFESWINYIQNAEKSSFCSGKIQNVHYKFTDGAEMIEEYSMETWILLRRSWKKKRNILDGTFVKWDIEVGDTFQSIDDLNFILKEADISVFECFNQNTLQF